MATHPIRLVGDPVLRQRAAEVTEIDDKLVRLADEMLTTMYEAPGVGLAAPQIGVRKRLFVYDIGEGPQVVINPTISETDGEWVYDEGCLSVPGLSWEIVRPKQVHLTGVDLDGNELSVEADELVARCFQHELDHLDGVLLLERLDADTRKVALKAIRERGIGAEVAGPAGLVAGGGGAGGGGGLPGLGGGGRRTLGQPPKP
jgi:peptide deformylase